MEREDICRLSVNEERGAYKFERGLPVNSDEYIDYSLVGPCSSTSTTEQQHLRRDIEMCPVKKEPEEECLEEPSFIAVASEPQDFSFASLGPCSSISATEEKHLARDIKMCPVKKEPEEECLEEPPFIAVASEPQDFSFASLGSCSSITTQMPVTYNPLIEENPFKTEELRLNQAVIKEPDGDVCPENPPFMAIKSEPSEISSSGEETDCILPDTLHHSSGGSKAYATYLAEVEMNQGGETDCILPDTAYSREYNPFLAGMEMRQLSWNIGWKPQQTPVGNETARETEYGKDVVRKARRKRRFKNIQARIEHRRAFHREWTRKRRQRETEEEAERRRAVEREAKRKRRANETLEEAERRRAAEREAKRKRRANESVEEGERRRAINRESKRLQRLKESLEKAELRRSANRELQRLRRFNESPEESERRRAADRESKRMQRINVSQEMTQQQMPPICELPCCNSGVFMNYFSPHLNPHM